MRRTAGDERATHQDELEACGLRRLDGPTDDEDVLDEDVLAELRRLRSQVRVATAALEAGMDLPPRKNGGEGEQWATLDDVREQLAIHERALHPVDTSLKAVGAVASHVGPPYEAAST